MGHGVTDEFEVDSGVDLTNEMVFGNQFVEGDGFKLVLMGEGCLSMAVSPLIALTSLDQSPGLTARTLSAV